MRHCRENCLLGSRKARGWEGSVIPQTLVSTYTLSGCFLYSPGIDANLPSPSNIVKLKGGGNRYIANELIGVSGQVAEHPLGRLEPCNTEFGGQGESPHGFGHV